MEASSRPSSSSGSMATSTSLGFCCRKISNLQKAADYLLCVAFDVSKSRKTKIVNPCRGDLEIAIIVSTVVVMTTTTIATVTPRLISASLLFLRGAGLPTLGNPFCLTSTEVHCCSVPRLHMIKSNRQCVDGHADHAADQLCSETETQHIQYSYKSNKSDALHNPLQI